MRRTLTMANLFENLAGTYNGCEALYLEEPLDYRLFQSQSLTYGDCVRFTNLAAEAFIRELDLKKGERVLLFLANPVEMLLVAVAVIKAGGVIVPLDRRLSEREVLHRTTGCGAGLVVADAGIVAERNDLLKGLRGLRWMVTGGESIPAADGLPRLGEAMEHSSGFFIPYTLKPGNVAALFYSQGPDGKTRAAMTTNEGLLEFRRAAALLLCARCGDTGVCSTSLEAAPGFTAAVLGLCAGLRLLMLRETQAERAVLKIEETGAAVFMGTPGAYAAMLKAEPEALRASPIRLWFVAGGGVPAQYAAGRASMRAPAVLVESYDAFGSATMLALKPYLPGLRWPRNCPGIAIPPNRTRIVDREWREVRRGAEGELAIRGPAVAPGYWDDLEYTLAAKKGRWLRTGVAARKNRLTISLIDT